MLSYSGGTAELSDLITYAKRFGIPLIGMAATQFGPDRGVRRGACPSQGSGSLPHGARADDLDHDDAGAWRRACRCSHGAPRVLRRSVSRPSIRAARSAARSFGSPTSCTGVKMPLVPLRHQ